MVIIGSTFQKVIVYSDNIQKKYMLRFVEGLFQNPKKKDFPNNYINLVLKKTIISVVIMHQKHPN